MRSETAAAAPTLTEVREGSLGLRRARLAQMVDAALTSATEELRQGEGQVVEVRLVVQRGGRPARNDRVECWRMLADPPEGDGRSRR